MVDIFYTHCQHLHLNYEGNGLLFPSEPHGVGERAEALPFSPWI